MANLPVPSSSGLGLTRVERRVAKEIAVTRAVTSVAAAREVAKIDAIAEVGETALTNAAVLTDLENFLVARNPAFASRAAFLNDGTVMSMHAVMARMARSL
jgi:hypothetical protein